MSIWYFNSNKKQNKNKGLKSMRDENCKRAAAASRSIRQSASESCRPFAFPDATMHSTYRVDSSLHRYYVTSMATVLSAILFSAGLSSS